MVSLRKLLAVSIDVAKSGGLEVKKVREQVKSVRVATIFCWPHIILLANMDT